MSRICDLIAAKGPQSGHNVSHSNRRTAKKFRPNLQIFTLKSELLKREFRLRLATSTIKTVDKHNGLDGFLTKVKTAKLTEVGKKLKKKVFALRKSPAPANN